MLCTPPENTAPICRIHSTATPLSPSYCHPLRPSPHTVPTPCPQDPRSPSSISAFIQQPSPEGRERGEESGPQPRLHISEEGRGVTGLQTPAPGRGRSRLTRVPRKVLMVRAAWHRAPYSSRSREMNWCACGGPCRADGDFTLDAADSCRRSRTFISSTYSLACCSSRWYSW